jgi:hypothetical protein
MQGLEFLLLILKIEADIHHFVFKRMLSARKKIFLAYTKK